MKPGRPDDWEPAGELEHYLRCPECGELFDMRDLRQVLEHLHDGEIEIVLEGSAWRPRHVKCYEQET